MVRQKKLAGYQLAVFAAALLLYLVLWPFVGPRAALSATGLLGLWGVTPFLFRKRAAPGEVLEDERDREILRRAAVTGFTASYAVFILASMGIWGYGHLVAGIETLSIHCITVPVWIAFATIVVVRAVVTLRLYGRDGEDAHGLP